jgi:polar amino acid transport system permease protein
LVRKRTGGLVLGAAIAAVLTLALAVATGLLARSLLITHAVHGLLADLLIALAVMTAGLLLWPAWRSFRERQTALTAWGVGDLVQARIATAASREAALVTIGYAAAGVLLLGFIQFVLANDMAVGRTFIFLPLIFEKWPLVLKAFWNNVFIFVVAEVLVLVWGLVVAIARLIPGPAGRPIRLLATLYCDIFRGLPAVVVLYLVGFGIPLSGILPATIPGIGKIPLVWWAVLALTLSYGAYVAEVYRAGIESIHWSQFAAARSLGLSYVQTLRYVIVPQAIRRIMAPLLNDFIGLQKDTALVNVIGVVDSFNQARIIASNAFNLSAVTIVAIIFVLITIPQARLVDRLLEADQRRMRAGS